MSTQSFCDMLPDELGQAILLHFGMDDTHPITTSLSCAVVTMTLRSGAENAKFIISSHRHQYSN